MAVNGRVYAFEDITLTIGSRRMVNVQAVDYSDGVEKALSHALGSKAPAGVGHGGYAGEGTITLLREGHDELLAQARKRGHRLYDMQFALTVCYGDEDGAMSTDEMPLCEFTRSRTGGRVGDQRLETEMNFIVVQPMIRNGVRSV
jgi:hypothetical protein